VDLKTTLETMMPTAFSGSADFGRMTAEQVEIKHAMQKASMKVTEVGTEASAAGCAGGSRGLSRPKQVICDREFLFFILDERNDMVLFAARVNDPTAVKGDKAPAAEEDIEPETFKEEVIYVEDTDEADKAPAAEEDIESGTFKEEVIYVEDTDEADKALEAQEEMEAGTSEKWAICIED
jgi:hypothetical protein